LVDAVARLRGRHAARFDARAPADRIADARRGAGRERGVTPSAPLVLLAAGGTGGHLFPAQAAAVALKKRGVRIALAADERVEHYSGDFPADSIHVVPSATLRGSGPLAYARTAAVLTLGFVKAWLLLGQLRPAAVVGFGGYPTVPPLKAAMLRGIPT